jgi:FolB domain-containing protein
MNAILIQDLALKLRLGVTEKERRRSQKVLLCLEIQLNTPEHIDDALDNTVDYSAVRRGLQSLLRGKPFNLVETVAAVTAEYVLNHYNAKKVIVTVKKFPYRDTAFVGCRWSFEK